MERERQIGLTETPFYLLLPYQSSVLHGGAGQGFWALREEEETP